MTTIKKLSIAVSAITWPTRCTSSNL